jgi:hypothetical protein
MSWQITGTEKTPVDRLGIANVSLLLHGDGTNGSTTIIDSSPTPKTVTAVGDAQISTAQSKFGGASLLFDGSGDGAIISTGLNDFTMTSNAYTLEAWARPAATSGFRPILTITASNVSFFGVIYLAISGTSLAWGTRHDTGSGFTAVNLTGGTVSAGNWYHVALSVDNGSARAFVDGTQVGTTATFTAPAFTIVGVGVGANGNQRNISSECFNGHIDEVRITKGIARYTANFTPPTAPFPDI